MSTDLPLIDIHQRKSPVVLTPGFREAQHRAEADMYSRQSAMLWHDQSRLERAHVGVVGCGGLGSWIAMGLARMGIRRLTLFDGDRFDRTNAPRQLMFTSDIGQFKAHALARNLAAHATGQTEITGMAQSFGESSIRRGQFDCLVVGVDNNRSRLRMSRAGLDHRVPVVFGMLSVDGLRAQVFLQRVGGPCLFCVLPNIDESEAAPCAAASIASCFLVAAHAVEVVVNAVMGIDRAPSWRETSLDGSREAIGRRSRPGQGESCKHRGRSSP